MYFKRINVHTASKLILHIVWTAKYRYAVLQGDIKMRCRTILIQICEAEGVLDIKL